MTFMVCQKTMIMSKQDSFLKQRIKPWKQGAVILALIILSQLVLYLFAAPESRLERLDYWIISASFLLFLAITNSIFSFNSESGTKYYGESVFTFMAVAITGGFTAYLFSGIALSEAGSFAWIYRVLTVIFVVFLTIVSLIRKIVELAKNQGNDKKHFK